MKNYMSSGGSSGNIDAPISEGRERHDSSEGGNEPDQLVSDLNCTGAKVQ